jgi:hypothetical protein
MPQTQAGIHLISAMPPLMHGTVLWHNLNEGLHNNNFGILGRRRKVASLPVQSMTDETEITQELNVAEISNHLDYCSSSYAI